MKIVLILTDFSSHAQNAVDYAVSMYADEGVRFKLLNSYTVEVPSYEISDPLFYNQFSINSEKELEEEEVRINRTLDLKTSTVETISEYGSLLDAIEKTTSDEKIDLLIMGTKGIGSIENVVLGSSAVSVIKHVNYPVLVIPENAKFSIPKKILFTSDYGELKDENIVSPLKEIAEKYNSELLILNIEEKEKDVVEVQEAMEALVLHNYLEPIKHKFHSMVQSRPSEGVVLFAEEYAVDLIVMVKREHSFFSEILKSSVTKKMTQHTTLPLLILHE